MTCNFTAVYHLTSDILVAFYGKFQYNLAYNERRFAEQSFTIVL